MTFFVFSLSKKQRTTNQLPVTLVMHEIVCTGHNYASKKSKTSQLFENLNDAYVCNLKIKFERKECVSMASCEVL